MTGSTSKATGQSRQRKGGVIKSYKALSLWTLAALGGASAQANTRYDPRTQVCSLRYHVSTVIGNTLYVEGGELLGANRFVNGTDKLLDDDVVIRWQNEHMWKLDLSKTFPTNRPPWEIEYKPESHEEHYNGARAALWNIENGKYTTVGGWFGVYYGPNTLAYGIPIIRDKIHYKLPDARAFTYNAATKTWTNEFLGFNFQRVSDSAHATSVRSQVGYAVGGILINDQQELGPNSLPAPVTLDWSRSMTVHDMRNNTWKSEALPRDINFIAQANLLSLDRVGVDGVLVLLGGTAKSDDGKEALRPLDKIWVYDVDSRVWSLQTASGDIPPARRLACTVVVPAPDFSSYQIYMFAGTVGNPATRVLDMHVLSVPAFVWTKIPITGYPDNFGISDHTCSLYNQRQMIIIPGERNVSTTAGKFMHKCDANLGIRVFDTYDWTFSDTFDPSKSGNKVPEAIVKIIEGDANGNAKMKAPRSGWEEKTLELAFGIRNSENKFNNGTNDPDENNQNPGDNNNEGNNGGEEKKEEKKKSSIGAIVGGIIGGIVAIAAIIALVMFLRKRKRNKVAAAVPQGHPMQGYGGPAEVSGQSPYWATQQGVAAGHQSHGAGYPTPYYDAPPTAGYAPHGAPYGAAPIQELGGGQILSAPQELSGASFYAPPKPDDGRGGSGLLAPGGVPAQGSFPPSPAGSEVYPVSPLDQGRR